MAGGMVPEFPRSGVSGLEAKALLGFMDREEATRFLLEDCVFQSPLKAANADEVWQEHHALVQSLRPDDSPRLQTTPLSAADLKTARKFRSRYPQANSITDFISLPPMDLVIHQLWLSTEIAERYSARVAPQNWPHTALLDSPPDAALTWRREGDAIVFDLPRYEYVLSGPSAPDGVMRPSSALEFVSVALHADRALLVSGYHRTFAAARYAREAANAPRGLLFGVSNFLQQMGDQAAELLQRIGGPRPPRLADFFDDRLAVPVALRRRRYRMRVYCEVTAIDAEEAQGAGDGSSVATTVPPPVVSRIGDLHAMLEDAQQHYSAGRLDAAAEQFRRILFLKPDHAEANSNLGVILTKQGRWEEAANQFQRALALKPDYVDAHFNLGCVYAAQGNVHEAIVHQRKAVAIDPRHVEAHHELGNVFRSLGRFEDALFHYDRALALNPDYTEAHLGRAQIKTFRPRDSDLISLGRAIGGSRLSADKEALGRFALATAFEDAGDYAQAWGHLRKANALKRSQIRYDESKDLQFFDRVASVFNGDLFNRFEGTGDPSAAPIFILGMPRSGSTLIEQILASHPRVHAGGEMKLMAETAAGILTGAEGAAYPEYVRDLDRAALQRAGAFYVSRLSAIGEGKARITDKTPGNFLQIGLIRLILPNAKIIHTVRNPLDTCVSCYSKLFESGQYYSYDLAELGRFYRRYTELMQHWRTVLSAQSMLEVVYEDVVDDIETQARRLIDYCGLPWDDRCLDFHKTDRTITTFSAFQVRQPLFRSSLQRWRRYESGLGPLLSELGDSMESYLPARARGASAANDVGA